jgi:hypothetical protein
VQRLRADFGRGIPGSYATGQAWSRSDTDASNRLLRSVEFRVPLKFAYARHLELDVSLGLVLRHGQFFFASLLRRQMPCGGVGLAGYLAALANRWFQPVGFAHGISSLALGWRSFQSWPVSDLSTERSTLTRAARLPQSTAMRKQGTNESPPPSGEHSVLTGTGASHIRVARCRHGLPCRRIVDRRPRAWSQAIPALSSLRRSP